MYVEGLQVVQLLVDGGWFIVFLQKVVLVAVYCKTVEYTVKDDAFGT